MRQRTEEAAKRSRGESSDYASVIARQTEGPLQKFLLPIGHSRQSKFKLFRMSLKCMTTTRVASFVTVRQLLTGNPGDEDDLPLDVLRSIKRRIAGECRR